MTPPAHPTHVTIPGRVKPDAEARALPMVEVHHNEHPSVKSRKLHGKFRGTRITVPAGKRLAYELVAPPAPRPGTKPRKPVTATVPKYKVWLEDDDSHFIDHPDKRLEDGTLVPAHRELRRGKKPAEAPKGEEPKGDAQPGEPHVDAEKSERVEREG